MAKAHLSLHHPSNTFFIFWMGLLTGAILVGLVFTYQAYKAANIQGAFLRSMETQEQLWTQLD